MIDRLRADPMKYNDCRLQTILVPEALLMFYCTEEKDSENNRYRQAKECKIRGKI